MVKQPRQPSKKVYMVRNSRITQVVTRRPSRSARKDHMWTYEMRWQVEQVAGAFFGQVRRARTLKMAKAIAEAL